MMSRTRTAVRSYGLAFQAECKGLVALSWMRWCECEAVLKWRAEDQRQGAVAGHTRGKKTGEGTGAQPPSIPLGQPRESPQSLSIQPVNHCQTQRASAASKFNSCNYF